MLMNCSKWLNTNRSINYWLFIRGAGQIATLNKKYAQDLVTMETVNQHNNLYAKNICRMCVMFFTCFELCRNWWEISEIRNLSSINWKFRYFNFFFIFFSQLFKRYLLWSSGADWLQILCEASWEGSLPTLWKLCWCSNFFGRASRPMGLLLNF